MAMQLQALTELLEHGQCRPSRVWRIGCRTLGANSGFVVGCNAMCLRDLALGHNCRDSEI